MVICEAKEKECCNNPNIIIDFRSSIYTCKNCGTTFVDISVVSQPKRIYNQDERHNRLNYEPYNRDFGASTYFDSRSDGKGKNLPPQTHNLFSRLSKINRYVYQSVERNYMIASPTIHEILKHLSLGNVVYETAWKIYKEAVEKRITMGRSIEAVCYASVYAALRIHGITISIDELCENIVTPEKSLHKTFSLVMLRVVQESKIKLNPHKMKEVIERLCNKMNASSELQSKAYALLKEAVRNGFEYQGKSRFGISASAIYLASRETNPPKTQKEIAIVANVTEVTLRNNLKIMQKYLKIDDKNDKKHNRLVREI